METLHALAIESHALEQMEQMQNGNIVNFIQGFPSEQRPALHTATRDFFENPIQSQPAVQAASAARKEVEKLKNCIKKIDDENRWSHIIVVGIGGSELGPKAHYEALQAYLKPGRSASFFE